MATAVLTNVPTTITLCESTTGWSGDTFSLEPDIKVQGSNSVACAMTNNGSNTIAYSTSFAITNVHLRLWVNLAFVGNINTQASDGIQVSVASGSGTALYTVGGSDTYAGGWTQFIVYTGNTPTSGSVPSGTCTAVGLQINTNTKPRNVPANCWVDAWYYGPGYTATGGTSGDEIDWSHIAALDAVQAYGIVTRLDDIYFLKGAVTIGSATTTWFKSAQKVQFANANVSSTLYGVTFAGSGCRVNITGGAWGAAGSQNYLVSGSDTSIVSFVVKGVQFSKASSILVNSSGTVQNTVFDSCGQVVPLLSTFSSNVFSNYTGTSGAVLYPSDDSNISNLTFINCDNGVQYTATSDASTPSFKSFVFDDVSGKYDVNNTSGSAVSIGNATGSNANSYNPGGSAVTFLANPVTLTIRAQDIDGNLIQDARVYVQAAAGGSIAEDTVIISGLTNASGIITDTRTYSSNQPLKGRVRKASSSPYYKTGQVVGTVNKDSGADITIIMLSDE